MKLWSVGIFKQDAFFNLENSSLSDCIKVFSSKKPRFRKKHIYTIADPFLFANQESLFLFAEINRFFDKGYIVCWETIDLNKWHFHGIILKQPYHISYPFIFRDNDDTIYMLPETTEADEVALWKFEKFPKQITRYKSILKGKWFDSNIFYSNGTYYLFTTSEKNELHIFYNSSLSTNTWQPHPSNPITNNKAYSRNGGGVLKINESLYRIAQNCSVEYGSNIVIRKILTLNPQFYEEVPCVDDFKPISNYRWQSLGRHHLSIVDFKSEKIIAMDGKEYDLYVNQLYSKSYSLIKRIKSIFKKNKSAFENPDRK